MYIVDLMALIQVVTVIQETFEDLALKLLEISQTFCRMEKVSCA